MTISEWDLFLFEQEGQARALRQKWEDSDPDFSAWICEQNSTPRRRRSGSSPFTIKRNFWTLFVKNLKELI